ncbi:hypothetical protein CHR56_38405 (plasmid) [Rhizobium leguminosarum bv. viciae]|nr:hypothetical protein CHR56_38405 [Rhizobium leguminosarum bv. viciae]
MGRIYPCTSARPTYAEVLRWRHNARFQVLCLTEEEKAAAFYRENPFISGELHRQVRAVAAKNDDLGRLLWDDPKISDDDLVGFANGECDKALYFANG